VAAIAVLIAVAGAAAAWWRTRDAGPRWAREKALPEIARLVDQEDYHGAFLLARRAAPHLPGDASLHRFWKDHTFPLTVETDPAGASVAIKPYREVDAPWVPLGETPLKEVRAPQTSLRLRIVKAGFTPLEVASDFSGPLRVRRFTLDAEAEAPKGMVRVSGGPHGYRAVPEVRLEDFWLDRYEVTNREFKEFVSAGGYTRPELWKEPFVLDGRALSFPEASARFRDATGRPGPATWELGTYPEGQADHPVGGVSWFEAAAYARFAGKELPTLHHWMRATGTTHLVDILLLSNFGGRGPEPAGRQPGVSAFGADDMAGNVKEWCSTASGAKRYILGGGWNEPSYMYMDMDAQSPWDRAPTYGFRCAKYAAPLPAAQLAPVAMVSAERNYAAEKPAADALFETYRRFYSYDKTPLEARVDAVQEAEHWRLEKVSFAAAYGGERVPAHLYLPRRGRPPYQVVVYWPAAEALRLHSSDDIRMKYMEYLLRSGRAVLHPIYKGTYERRLARAFAGPSEVRDTMVYFSKDLGRSLDYLETRPDVDAKRLAFYGNSLGATIAPVMLAVEPRFGAAVLQGGGLESWRPLPEADPFHFAPHARAPVLMLNGRYDFALPVETSQRALLRLFGARPEDKRHVVFEAGHAGFAMHDVIREVLDWLDRYLGPVGPEPLAPSAAAGAEAAPPVILTPRASGGQRRDSGWGRPEAPWRRNSQRYTPSSCTSPSPSSWRACSSGVPGWWERGCGPVGSTSPGPRPAPSSS
jgi:dienelactone hydrolase